MSGSFFDSTVLLYLASRDTGKAVRAESILADGGTISVQVLNEVANLTRRKMRMSWRETHAFLSLLRGLVAVHPVTLATHAAGLALAERYGLSVDDAMIAAVALQAGCDRLWSEDMQHGMVLDEGLRIVDPFRVG